MLVRAEARALAADEKYLDQWETLIAEGFNLRRTMIVLFNLGQMYVALESLPESPRKKALRMRLLEFRARVEEQAKQAMSRFERGC